MKSCMFTIMEIRFQKIIEDITRLACKIPKSEYSSIGKYPIIDQGQIEIAGYTNDEKLIYDDSLPVIVFGDHTKVFKFVNQPFVIGADGLKVLRIKDDSEPRYIFYSLWSCQLPEAGYSRHYKFLKDVTFSIPSLQKQRQISQYLDRKTSLIDSLIERLQRKIQLLKEYRQSLISNVVTGKVKVTEDKL